LYVRLNREINNEVHILCASSATILHVLYTSSARYLVVLADIFSHEDEKNKLFVFQFAPNIHSNMQNIVGAINHKYVMLVSYRGIGALVVGE